jgi:signal transduction histidine kinase
LKRKFFWTVFICLLATITIVSSIHFWFFRLERLRLIDQQIEIVASNILASGLDQDNVDATSEMISDILDEEPTISLVSLYRMDGRILFRNASAKTILKDWVVNFHDQKLIAKLGDHDTRFINFPLEGSALVLQVGVLMDSELSSWKQMRISMFLYLGALMCLVLVISLYLSKRLLHPLQSLSGYLTHVTQRIGSHGSSMALPTALDRELHRETSKDEFSELIVTTRELTEKLSRRFQVSQKTAAQMAHELKTPLTILRNMIESGSNREEILAELERLSHMIQQFLNWSRFEFDHQKDAGVHAVKVSDLVRAVVGRFSSLAVGRIQLVEKADHSMRLFCDPDLLDQAISNLLDNAIKYSPADSPIVVEIRKESIEIWDQGSGIPKNVEVRLGEPFNVSLPQKVADGTSFGLGLAWVVSIVRAYGWVLNFEKTARGFCVRVEWKKESISEASEHQA